MRGSLVVIVLLLAAAPAWGSASDWAVNEQSRVRLITPYRTAPRDGEIQLGLHFKLAPGWHVYWKNSGDAGFPPVVVFGQAPGLDEPELLWPAPERFELPGDLVAFGYENEVVYPVRARLSDPPGDVLKLSADVDYLVCEVDCIPYRYTLRLDQPLAAPGSGPEPDPEAGPLIASWWDRLPVPAAALAGVTTEGALVAGAGGPALEVRVDGVEAGTEPPWLFLEVHEAFDTGKPEVRTTDRGVTFRVPLRPKKADSTLPEETGFAWTVTNLVRAGRPVSLEARQTVPRSEAAAATAAAPPGSRESLLRSPILAALLAVGAALLALWLWGVLGPPSEKAGREALGFAALAAVLGLLYALSRQVSFEGLAWIELTLLGMSLCAWLRRKAADRRALRLVLGLGLLACALAAPWLADRNRLDGHGPIGQVTSIEEETDA